MKETMTLLADKVHEQELQHKEICSHNCPAHYILLLCIGIIIIIIMVVSFLKEFFFLILVYCLFQLGYTAIKVVMLQYHACMDQFMVYTSPID